MCFPDFMSYWDQVQICHLCQTAHDPALESSLRLISNIVSFKKLFTGKRK